MKIFPFWWEKCSYNFCRIWIYKNFKNIIQIYIRDLKNFKWFKRNYKDLCKKLQDYFFRQKLRDHFQKIEGSCFVKSFMEAKFCWKYFSRKNHFCHFFNLNNFEIEVNWPLKFKKRV